GGAVSVGGGTWARGQLGWRQPPQHGQASRWYSAEEVSRSGGTGARWCLGWPGWPPIFRGPGAAESAAGWGLAMSDDGGFDEVEEFFMAAASCSRSSSTSARKALISAARVCRGCRSGRQLGQCC